MPLGFDDSQALRNSSASSGERWPEARGVEFGSSGIASKSWANLHQGYVAVIAAFVALATIVVLSSQSPYVRLMAVALVGGAALIWAAYQTVIDPRWLVLALVLEETLPYLNLIPADPESRWFLRYPLLFAFCLPAIPAAWKSGVLTKGCFLGFLAYFGWGAVSIAYSIDPASSAGRLVPGVLVFLSLSMVACTIQTVDDIRTVFERLLIGFAFLVGLLFITATVFPVNVMVEGESPPIGVYNWVLDQSGLMRFSGFSYNPNEVGAIMLATVSVSLVVWPRFTRRGKFALALLMAASLVFGLMADSRSPFIVMVISWVAFAIWKYRLRGMVVCAALLVVGVFAYTIYGIGTGERFNRDVTTLTGRTEAWQFEAKKIVESPFIGYGYSVEGAIFQDPRFPNWEKFWDQGANTSLHNSYMSVAVGLGVPALCLVLFLILRPWIAVLRSDDDPWDLKRLFFFIALPMFILGLDETGLAEPRYVKGALFFLCWALAERWRLTAAGRRRPATIRLSLFAPAASVILLIALATLVAATTVDAAQYYVDATAGDDAHAGTSPAQAWRSLSKVDAFPFQPGDVVHLSRNSVWRDVLKPNARGEANFSGVTFSSYGNGSMPTINGSDVVSGWSAAGSAYAAPETLPVFNVFVDQKPGWGLLHACCTSSHSCSPPASPSQGQTCTIGRMQPGSWYWSGPSPEPGDAANTLYIWLADGGDPAGHSVEAVTRKAGVLGYARSNQLDNLTLDGLRIVQAGLRGISLQSGDLAGCCGSRGLGSGKGIQGLVIKNCVIERTGTGKADDGSYGNAVTVINATAPIIENNQVSYAGNHGNCLNIQNASGAKITGNRVDHWNHNGIDVKGSRDVLVENNIASDQPNMGAGFYTEFSSNVQFRDNRAADVSNGFQISGGASATVANNSIQSAGTGIFFGPHSVALNATGNTASLCRVAVSGDGSGSLTQTGNSWSTR